MTGGCVEWIADGKVIGKSHDVDIKFEGEKYKPNEGWSELSINGLVFGEVRNFERLNPNQTRAEFKPAPYFGDWANDERAMEFNSVLFCHDTEGDHAEVFFERRGK